MRASGYELSHRYLSLLIPLSPSFYFFYGFFYCAFLAFGGEKSLDKLIVKAQALMDKITSSPDNPNPNVLHALASILETQEFKSFYLYLSLSIYLSLSLSLSLYIYLSIYLCL